MYMGIKSTNLKGLTHWIPYEQIFDDTADNFSFLDILITRITFGFIATRSTMVQE